MNADKVRLSTSYASYAWWSGLCFEGRLTANERGTRVEGRFRLYGQQAILVVCLVLCFALVGTVAALSLVQLVGPDGQPVWNMLGALPLAALVLGFGLLSMAGNEWVAEAEENYLRSFMRQVFEATNLDGDMNPGTGRLVAGRRRRRLLARVGGFAIGGIALSFVIVASGRHPGPWSVVATTLVVLGFYLMLSDRRN